MVVSCDISAFLPISTYNNPFESCYVELNFRKKKWLLNWSYHSNNNNMESHLNGLSRSIDSLLSKYGNIVLLGDFNSCVDDSPIIGFCETWKLCNLHVSKIRRILHVYICY